MRVFQEQIINFIYRIVTGSKRIRMILTPLVGFFFLCIVLLLTASSFFLDRFLGLPEYISKPFNTLLCFPFFVGGTFLWLWCLWIFLKNNGTPVPLNPPPKLITNGPYAYSRNPMMTGLFMIMTGTGIFFGSMTLTFVMTPMFVLISILEFKSIEEPELEKRFGDTYVAYRKKTPIIIPKIHSK